MRLQEGGPERRRMGPYKEKSHKLYNDSGQKNDRFIGHRGFVGENPTGNPAGRSGDHIHPLMVNGVRPTKVRSWGS